MKREVGKANSETPSPGVFTLLLDGFRSPRFVRGHSVASATFLVLSLLLLAAAHLPEKTSWTAFASIIFWSTGALWKEPPFNIFSSTGLTTGSLVYLLGLFVTAICPRLMRPVAVASIGTSLVRMASWEMVVIYKPYVPRTVPILLTMILALCLFVKPGQEIKSFLTAIILWVLVLLVFDNVPRSYRPMPLEEVLKDANSF